MSWSFVNPLSRRPKAGYPDAVAQIQTATRALFGLTDDVVVLVTEINCCEAGCPDVETVVAVLRAGEKPCTAKFRKPLRDVTEHNLSAEFARLGWQVSRVR
jgi:hypothetical protein